MKFIKNIFKKKNTQVFIDDSDKNTVFENTDTKLGKYSNYGLIFLIFISVFLVMFESIGNNGEKYLYYIFYTDLFISIIFGIEYIYRFIKSDEKARFPFRFSNFLDLLSFLPFFIAFLFLGIGHYAIFALFRMFRVLKIFELFSHVPILFKLSKGIYKHKFEYLSAFAIVFIIIIFFSTAIFYIENMWGDSTDFSSIPATMWWSVVTMTTVGYGDIVPLTTFGKILAGFLMFLGPVVIAIISSITVFVFLDSTKLIDFGKINCSNCGTENTKDSKYCKNCAYKFKK